VIISKAGNAAKLEFLIKNVLLMQPSTIFYEDLL